MTLNAKIIYGLERLSDAFRSLLRDKAKAYKLSPIQIQLLLFIANHNPALCHVTHLSKEFNLTKATISDAVRVLLVKGYVEKDFSPSDSRSYTLFLTPNGKALIEDLSDFSLPFEHILSESSSADLESLYGTLTQLIYKLNQQGVIQVQRTCLACRFHTKKGRDHFCNLLNERLSVSDLRLDCPEYETQAIN